MSRNSVESAPKHVRADEPAPGALQRGRSPAPAGRRFLWKQRGVLLAGADLLSIFAVGVLVHAVHGRWLSGQGTWGTGGLEAALRHSAVLAALWVVLIWRQEGYEPGLRGLSSPMVRAKTLLSSGAWAAAALLIVSMVLDFHAEPAVYGGILLVATVMLFAIRKGARRLGQRLARNGEACRQVVVAGTDRTARDFAVRLRASGSAVRVIGFVDGRGGAPASMLGCPVLGSIQDIESIHDRHPFQMLILSREWWREGGPHGFDDPLALLSFCEQRGVELYVAADLQDFLVTRQEVATFSNVPLIRLRDAAGYPPYGVLKRLADIVVSALLLVVLAPIWLAIAAAIKLHDGGPAFYFQTRIGLHGKPFRMCKFRSMVVDAEQRLESLVELDALSEPVFKLRNDPRVTPIGRFLRRTSLDELPQLWNILKGEMSFIGPRPEEERIVAMYNTHQRRRLKIRPGLTGLQQVECRGTTSLARRVAYDLVYMKHEGPVLDLYILLKTIAVVLRGEGITH